METERLEIRRFNGDDWEDLYAYLSKPEVVKYEPYDVFTEEECIETAKIRSNDQSPFWAVCLKENGKVIGQLYLNQQEPDHLHTWSLGYVFNPNYHRKGYATEAAGRILQYTFETLNAHRVVAYTNVRNVQSWQLLERLKFRREGHMLQNVYFKRTDENEPIWVDSYQYAILYHEWINKLK